MRQICFFLMMLIALTASAAGIQKLIDSLNKKPTSPQPVQQPQAPNLPVKK